MYNVISNFLAVLIFYCISCLLSKPAKPLPHYQAFRPCVLLICLPEEVIFFHFFHHFGGEISCLLIGIYFLWACLYIFLEFIFINFFMVDPSLVL